MSARGIGMGLAELTGQVHGARNVLAQDGGLDCGPVVRPTVRTPWSP